MPNKGGLPLRSLMCISNVFAHSVSWLITQHTHKIRVQDRVQAVYEKCMLFVCQSLWCLFHTIIHTHTRVHAHTHAHTHA
jgi:hypothetical protein